MAEWTGEFVQATREEAPPGAGEPAGKWVRLGLEEAAYLCERGRLTVHRNGAALDSPSLLREASARRPGFEVRYPVYRSLRLRGYRLAPGPRDFRLYKRGTGPGGGPSDAYLWALSDREPMALQTLAEGVAEASNVRKRLLLGFVDTEGDIVFYEVRWPHLPEGKPPDLEVLEGAWSGNRVLVADGRAAEWHRRTLFGRVEEGRLWLSRLEAAYLEGRGVLRVSPAPKTRGGLRLRGRGRAEFEERLKVYRDLRDRGLVARTGFKFGTHFRVYKEWPARHSTYLVHVLGRDHLFLPEEISRAVRLAHSVRKRMVFAHVEGERARYLEVARERL